MRKRSLVARALENPAYWRMVHRRPRYMVGRMPRVKGYSPGKPPSAAPPYSGSWTSPEGVRNTVRRSGWRARALDHTCSRHPAGSRFERVVGSVRVSSMEAPALDLGGGRTVPREARAGTAHSIKE